MNLDSHGGMILAWESRRTRIKTFPSFILPTNFPLTYLGANPASRDERPATNRLSYITETRWYVGLSQLFDSFGSCLILRGIIENYRLIESENAMP
jgi:hypothetical protein